MTKLKKPLEIATANLKRQVSGTNLPTTLDKEVDIIICSLGDFPPILFEELGRH